jgi:hypothetical protein
MAGRIGKVDRYARASARALKRKPFEAAMRSQPVLKLILENATPDRISGLA